MEGDPLLGTGCWEWTLTRPTLFLPAHCESSRSSSLAQASSKLFVNWVLGVLFLGWGRVKAVLCLP